MRRKFWKCSVGEVIVALGARTALGHRAATTACAVLAGIARIQAHPRARDKAGDPFLVAYDRSIPASTRLPRMAALAESALREAMSNLPTQALTHLPIFLGLPEFGPFFAEHHASEICVRLSAALRGSCPLTILSVPQGDAAGVYALEHAIAGLRDQAFELCLVGGVDSLVDALQLEALDESRRVRSASNRWGFYPGEGAAVLALTTHSFAHRHRMPILAQVLATGSAIEASSMHSRQVCVGEGLAGAMRTASHALPAVGRQYCDINGERYREHEYAYAILRVPADTFVDSLDYEAPADRWGNPGAASAPLLALLPIVAHARRPSLGGDPMIWCSSENGYRGAIVLRLEKCRQ